MEPRILSAAVWPCTAPPPHFPRLPFAPRGRGRGRPRPDAPKRGGAGETRLAGSMQERGGRGGKDRASVSESGPRSRWASRPRPGPCACPFSPRLSPSPRRHPTPPPCNFAAPLSRPTWRAPKRLSTPTAEPPSPGSSCKRRSWARPRLPRSPPERADWKGGARTTRRRCAAAPLHAWAGRGPGPAPTA